MPGSIKMQKWKEQIRVEILNGTKLDWPFLLMNILAATIASYGLLANSPAIIIGAMIVAMLLGPITGVALALVDSNLKLLRQGLTTLLVGSIAVIITSFIIGYSLDSIPLTSEIVARTTPNLLDLMVALAGGAAGAYATISPRLSVAFVGVAIATALVPPLCAASILFAHGEFFLSMGAVLLTFTNMVAIQFSSSIVFWLCGFHKLSQQRSSSLLLFFKQNSVSLILLGLLALFLTSSLNDLINKQLFETTVRQSLKKMIEREPGNFMVETRFEKKDNNSLIVIAVIRGSKPPTFKQVANMQEHLPHTQDNLSIELRIRFVKVLIINRSGYLYNSEIDSNENNHSS